MLKKLIKERFDLWCKMNWLRTIDREYKKFEKYHNKTMRSKYVIEKLVERYNELYPKDGIKFRERESR